MTDGGPVAVRSSASDEDGEHHSFAGPTRPASCSSRPRTGPPTAFADVWRSAFSDRIIAYRREHGLPPAPAPARRAHPADDSGGGGRRRIRGRPGERSAGAWPSSSAVLGLGTALVGGDADARHLADPTATAKVIEHNRAHKSHMHVATPDGEGFKEVPTPADKADAPALTDAQARRKWPNSPAARGGTLFGRPQDIEWALRRRAASPC